MPSGAGDLVFYLILFSVWYICRAVRSWIDLVFYLILFSVWYICRAVRSWIDLVFYLILFSVWYICRAVRSRMDDPHWAFLACPCLTLYCVSPRSVSCVTRRTVNLALRLICGRWAWFSATNSTLCSSSFTLNENKSCLHSSQQQPGQFHRHSCSDLSYAHNNQMLGFKPVK